MAHPIDSMRGRWAHLFPPNRVVIGLQDVRENRIFLNHFHGIRIGLIIGARRHAEETRLGILRPQPPIWPDAKPSDIVADRPDFVAGKALRGEQSWPDWFSRIGWERRRKCI